MDQPHVVEPKKNHFEQGFEGVGLQFVGSEMMRTEIPFLVESQIRCYEKTLFYILLGVEIAVLGLFYILLEVEIAVLVDADFAVGVADMEFGEVGTAVLEEAGTVAVFHVKMIAVSAAESFDYSAAGVGSSAL